MADTRGDRVLPSIDSDVSRFVVKILFVETAKVTIDRLLSLRYLKFRPSVRRPTIHHPSDFGTSSVVVLSVSPPNFSCWKHDALPW